MKAKPKLYEVVVDSSKYGMIELPSGLLVEGWKEEFSCDIDGHILRGRIETPKQKTLAESNARRKADTEQLMAAMARTASSDLDRLFRINGTALEEVEVKAKPLEGTELIRLRELAQSIHRTNPKWQRDKVNRVMALARLGQGPFAGEWARMIATGPSEKDAPNAPGTAD